MKLAEWKSSRHLSVGGSGICTWPLTGHLPPATCAAPAAGGWDLVLGAALLFALPSPRHVVFVCNCVVFDKRIA